MKGLALGAAVLLHLLLALSPSRGRRLLQEDGPAWDVIVVGAGMAGELREVGAAAAPRRRKAPPLAQLAVPTSLLPKPAR